MWLQGGFEQSLLRKVGIFWTYWYCIDSEYLQSLINWHQESGQGYNANDPSVAFSHSFTSSSASHVVAYEIRQAGYPLSASSSATIFPLKSPLRNQDLFERMFCLSDRCFSATWQHFPQVREAPGFVANECWQADLAYSGLLFESFWRVERRKFPRRIGHDSASTVDGRDPAPGAQCPIMRVSIANWQVIKKDFAMIG